jgi:hypothetical protein
VRGVGLSFPAGWKKASRGEATDGRKEKGEERGADRLFNLSTFNMFDAFRTRMK